MDLRNNLSLRRVHLPFIFFLCQREERRASQKSPDCCADATILCTGLR